MEATGPSTVTHPFETGTQTPAAATNPTAQICITNVAATPATAARLWDVSVLVDGVILETSA